MIQFYDKNDLLKAEKQKKNLLIIFFCVLAVYLGICVWLLTVFLSLPYGSGKLAAVKWSVYGISALFMIFSCTLFGLPFKRAAKFAAVCKSFEGIKETSVATFKGYDDTLFVKDGVDSKSLIFSEYNKYKKTFYDRKALVFYEKPFPEIEEGAEVEFVTHGNFLLSYQIIGQKEKV